MASVLHSKSLHSTSILCSSRSQFHTRYIWTSFVAFPMLHGVDLEYRWYVHIEYKETVLYSPRYPSGKNNI